MFCYYIYFVFHRRAGGLVSSLHTCGWSTTEGGLITRFCYQWRRWEGGGKNFENPNLGSNELVVLCKVLHVRTVVSKKSAHPYLCTLYRVKVYLNERPPRSELHVVNQSALMEC